MLKSVHLLVTPKIVSNLNEFNALKMKTFRKGSIVSCDKMLSVNIPYVLKLRNTRSIEFVSWTPLDIEKSLSYCLEGLRHSPFAYLTFICLYPIIRWLKISSTLEMFQ